MESGFQFVKWSCNASHARSHLRPSVIVQRQLRIKEGPCICSALPGYEICYDGSVASLAAWIIDRPLAAVRTVRVAKAWNETVERSGTPACQLLIWFGRGWAPWLGIELRLLALHCLEERGTVAGKDFGNLTTPPLHVLDQNTSNTQIRKQCQHGLFLGFDSSLITWSTTRCWIIARSISPPTTRFYYAPQEGI